MIYIAIGSNLGNRVANIRKAVDLLKKEVVYDSYESIILETKALLLPNSPTSWDKPYLNMIVAGQTKLSPLNLLYKLQKIEKQISPVPKTKKWAPRTIDLDILIYGDQTIDDNDFKIPHPELFNRDFLIHLLALMPERYIPKIKLNNKSSIRIDEHAYHNLDYTKLFSKSFVLGPAIFAILNVTQDSFSDGGKSFIPENAIKNAYNMVSNGAEIIDIGAQSTNPRSVKIIGPDEEYLRLKPVLDGIKDIDAQISIDSYQPKLIKKLLNKHKIDWINDVSGSLDKETLKEISSAGVKIVTMHSLSVPVKKLETLPHKANALELIQNWIDKILATMHECGFSSDDIILDPGIGFGKSLYQDITILKNINQLKKRGCKILVGHSRKSFMHGFSCNLASNRDLETAIISNNISENNVDYIRIHNMEEHYRALVTNKILSK